MKMEGFMSKDKMKDEQISFAEVKEFLNKVHDALVDLLEQNKITESYRMYPAEDFLYYI